MGLSQAQAQVALEAVIPNGSTRYVGLLTALPTNLLGAGLVELSGVTGYARQSKNLWVTSLYPDRVEREAQSMVGWTVGANGWSGIMGWGIWTAVSGGSLVGWGKMLDDALQPGPFSYPAGDTIELYPFKLTWEF